MRWWVSALVGVAALGVVAVIVVTALGAGRPADPTPTASAPPSAEPTEELAVPEVAVELTGTLRALPDSGTDRVFHLDVAPDTVLPVTVPPELDVITDRPVRVTVLVPGTVDLTGTDTDRIRQILAHIDGERGRAVEVTAISE